MDAHAVVSLLASAAGDASGKAFAHGAALLKLGWAAPLAACVQAATADGVFNLAEAELVRLVAATLDCPVPPILAGQDPVALAA